MSAIVTSLFEALMGLLVNEARDRAAKKLKDGDVMEQKIGELIQRDIDDIKLKLDALLRLDLLTAMDKFETGFRCLCQVLEIDYNRVTSALFTNEPSVNAPNAPALTSAIEQGERNLGIKEFGDEAKRLLRQGKRSFRVARESATKAFNNEALDTVHRIAAIRYRVMAAMLESLAESLAATTDLSSLSREKALQTAGPEWKQSLQRLHSLPKVKKIFEVALGSGLCNNIKRQFGQYERTEIIRAICLVNRFIYDVQKSNWNDYRDLASIEIGENSINPLRNRKVMEILEKAGMQHCSIEW